MSNFEQTIHLTHPAPGTRCTCPLCLPEKYALNRPLFPGAWNHSLPQSRDPQTSINEACIMSRQLDPISAMQSQNYILALHRVLGEAMCVCGHNFLYHTGHTTSLEPDDIRLMCSGGHRCMEFKLDVPPRPEEPLIHEP